MIQIRTGIILAGIAVTLWIERTEIIFIDILADGDAAFTGHQGPMAMSDVFDTEPPLSKEEPLLKAPHMIVTPHIGFATKEAMEIRAQIVFDNLQSYLAGTPANRVL